MTVNIGRTRGPSPAGESRRRAFTPSLTQSEAASLGYSKQEYAEAVNYARLSAEYHDRRGTERSGWEPPEYVGNASTASFIADADAELENELDADPDRLLGAIQDAITDCVEALDEIDERVEPLTTLESGSSRSVAATVALVSELDKKIEEDEDDSRGHHRRAHPLLVQLAPWVPYVETIGYLYFLAAFLNVPILEPWVDFGAWTLSVAITVATIAGQTWFVHHGARAHNHGREAMAENNREEGERAFRWRNIYFGLVAGTATAAITTGVVLRGLMTLGDVGPVTAAFVVFTAVVAGYIMPALGVLAEALDGSKRSRERDDLVLQLDADLARHSELREHARQSLAEVKEIYKDLVTSVFPRVIEQVQAIVDEAYRPYCLTRVLIGGLSAEPPLKVEPIFKFDDAGVVASGGIVTSIPGADSVNLKPLLDRATRLTSLLNEVGPLEKRLAEVPHHPWSNDRAR